MQKTKKRTLKYFLLMMKLYLILLFLSPFLDNAFGLGEEFEIYNSPQGLAMGNALSADSSGYAAGFYNPAGVATLLKRRWEVNLVDLEGSLGLNGISSAWKNQSFGAYRILGNLKTNAGTYTYFNYATVPSFTMRGFSFALLGSYQFAGLSDGTHADLDIRQDVGTAVSFGRNFAGNLLKLGVTGKFIVRNQMKGIFSHDALATKNDSTFPELFKEGYGIGADLGLLLTLPQKYIPTLGITWRDVLDTHFSAAHILNNQAQGVPDKIPQSINAAFSIHPNLTSRLKSIFSIEYKHIELGTMPFRKHLHLGIQLEDYRELYFWAGLNQLYITAGIGYRVKGGNLEIATYGEDVGAGNTSKEDRRIVFRYTISF